MRKPATNNAAVKMRLGGIFIIDRESLFSSAHNRTELFLVSIRKVIALMRHVTSAF